MAKTITVNVDEELDQQFRARVMQVYGDAKGALGKAISEAIKHWLEHSPSYEKRAVELMDKGYHLGGGPYYKNRDELYERTRRH